ncbi:HAD family hydrolase [Micromonospora saelicesensis]|uniref:Beta-phosphoglucomutase n=1 Tax=Micromonospora saelicesensis TaxID=285676 RepID=A0A1C4VE46_9ACTN|nr:HAD family phosphatase [Micromonospora saelicesensis]RAN97338.1 Beta-phosphoglucomutase [Micromonospora saelicesensis]RAO44032.1 Beta-phosphoglucomutase [Micromonospora saelicesensis]RAO49820.1 Beta-phosphoglucomutase [Micromonospora saelicesensis]RAO54528.1 Beta-phosphoglucomutase [Micromonospora saelicesensis]SCE82263.1 haloacid dehalogenase superfamily, subfamily IA, variant 3 with third motif having DD or ED/beta-phosphoglucomutase family hydrolase [Micromonospora saelicesensis]
MSLPLPPGPFAAYLFDCDGTIVDSMPLHYLAWQRALEEWGCEFPEDLFYAWGGRPTADIIVALNEQQGLAMPVAAVVERRESYYQELLPQLAAVPEVLAHIHDAHRRVPFAVVSGSTRASVTASLDALGLLDRFDVLVCADDYTRAKPDPQAFLLAAEQLGVPPESCLVFEDTDLGIQAATAAGMASVRVPQQRTP